jgi:ketosteroid isomerase-like protein
MVFEAMNSRDLETLADILHPDAVFLFPGTNPLEGPEAIGRFLKILFRRFPRLCFTTGRLVLDEDADRAAAEWTVEGEDRRGGAYRNAGVTVIELNGGKIVYMSDTFKDTSIFTR